MREGCVSERDAHEGGSFEMSVIKIYMFPLLCIYEKKETL